MGTVLIILHVVVCTFLILVVLLQSGKGGGLGAIGGGGGSGSVFGGRGASTFLSKTTAVMAGLFMLFSVLLTLVNFSDDLEAAVQVFYVRRGKVLGRKGFVVDRVEDLAAPELVGEVLSAHYRQDPPRGVPRSVLVPALPDDAALLAECGALGVDLLVMGAYTHSRLRHLIFGGATSGILAHGDIPVLMQH